MSFQIAKPSKLLSSFVKQYWAMETLAPDNGKYVHRVIPNGLLELTFYFENPPSAIDASKSFNDNSLISGQQQEFFDLEITARNSMFSVSIKPHGG